ncbi:helix-turn-helix domain-containing protein [Methylobacterium brachiatum]|uniref:helix-turn-helix domain-containing protein n=1 Tax=Methylobacterium brachiatum TaxID=269660 RepID=UPI00352223E1|nr:helix-turn-helix domain-containing protein [Methylobacterium brachiatum]
MAVAAGYRYRFDPTPEQADLLRRTFGCVRSTTSWPRGTRSGPGPIPGDRLWSGR